MVMMEEAHMNSTSTRYVYRFGGGVNDGGNGDKNLLGGKGANLDGMAAIGLPVPPGFTITTDMCTRYYQDGGVFPDSLRAEVANGIAHIEGVTGKRFGDTGLIRFKIPYTWSDPRQFAEIMPVPAQGSPPTE